MKKIIDLLSSIDGVIAVSQIEKESREQIIELEKDYENGSVIGLHNLGIRKVLECNTVFAILKNTGFRPPPGATVFLVESIDNDEDKEYLLNVGSNNYRIIGEELINKKPSEDEDYMYISEDFVLYPERRKNRIKNPAFFLIPPLGFMELENVKNSFNLKNIISVSPSTMADLYIRKQCDFSPSEKLATILIGYDSP